MKQNPLIVSLKTKYMFKPEPSAQKTDEDFDRGFRPIGAMFFFVLLVILGLIIWYGIYLLMLNRV